MVFYTHTIESNQILNFTPSDVARVDFKIMPDLTVLVCKYNAQNRILHTARYLNFNLSAAAKWLTAQGWTIHDFTFHYTNEPVYPGMRAWRGQPMPIRGKEEIKKLRSLIQMQCRSSVDYIGSFNLAFDL